MILKTLQNNQTIISLSLYGLTSLHSIYFKPDYEKDKELVLELTDILANNLTITNLDLSNLSFNYSEGFGNTISTILKQNTTLTSLDLSQCSVGYYYDKIYDNFKPVKEESFYKALKENTTLTSLKMTIYFFDGSYRVIRKLADSLSKNTGLVELKLDTYSTYIYDNFDDIMSPLKNNTTLTSLSLIRYTTKQEWEEWWGEDECPSYYEISYP